MLALSAAVLAGCGSGDDEGWTVRQAESIRSIRGMPVHEPRCHGVGAALGDGGLRYRRLACQAGARRSGERYDTVGVFYEVVPDDGDYRLERVHFVGGPGVP